jgi:hypothetical protein
MLGHVGWSYRFLDSFILILILECGVARNLQCYQIGTITFSWTSHFFYMQPPSDSNHQAFR